MVDLFFILKVLFLECSLFFGILTPLGVDGASSWQTLGCHGCWRPTRRTSPPTPSAQSRTSPRRYASSARHCLRHGPQIHLVCSHDWHRRKVMPSLGPQGSPSLYYLCLLHVNCCTRSFIEVIRPLVKSRLLTVGTFARHSFSAQ